MLFGDARLETRSMTGKRLPRSPFRDRAFCVAISRPSLGVIAGSVLSAIPAGQSARYDPLRRRLDGCLRHRAHIRENSQHS